MESIKILYWAYNIFGLAPLYNFTKHSAYNSVLYKIYSLLFYLILILGYIFSLYSISRNSKLTPVGRIFESIFYLLTFWFNSTQNNVLKMSSRNLWSRVMQHVLIPYKPKKSVVVFGFIFEILFLIVVSSYGIIFLKLGGFTFYYVFDVIVFIHLNLVMSMQLYFAIAIKRKFREFNTEIKNLFVGRKCVRSFTQDFVLNTRFVRLYNQLFGESIFVLIFIIFILILDDVNVYLLQNKSNVPESWMTTIFYFVCSVILLVSIIVVSLLIFIWDVKKYSLQKTSQFIYKNRVLWIFYSNQCLLIYVC